MAESVGTWFPQVGVVLVVLIPKHDGGEKTDWVVPRSCSHLDAG